MPGEPTGEMPNPEEVQANEENQKFREACISLDTAKAKWLETIDKVTEIVRRELEEKDEDKKAALEKEFYQAGHEKTAAQKEYVDQMDKFDKLTKSMFRIS